MQYGPYIIDEFITFSVDTTKQTTENVDADAAPTYYIYEDEVETAKDTGSMSKLDDSNTTGFYTERVQLTSAKYSYGKTYNIYIKWAASTKNFSKIHNFILRPPSGYALGAVWIDTNNGTSGDISNVNGIATNPVDNFTDAMTIASNMGLTAFRVASESSITLNASVEGKEFIGQHWTLALGSQNCADTIFTGANITGVCTGANKPHFNDCEIAGVTLPPSHLHRCVLTGTITVGTLGDFFLNECWAGSSGVNNPIIDTGASIGDVTIHNHHFGGTIEYKNLGQVGTDLVHMSGHGKYILDATCNGGTIHVSGNIEKEDNSGGTVTINNDANANLTNINAEVDTAIATMAADAVIIKNEVLSPDGTVVSDAGNTTLTFKTNLTSNEDDYLIDAYIKFKDGNLVDQIKKITAYNGTTKFITVIGAFTAAPSGTPNFDIINR